MATTALDFKGSGLTEFPRQEVFAHADTLEFLDISGNRIESLPEDLGRLQRLRIFFASGNPIHHLPASLGNCPDLRTLGLRGCEIESLDPGAFAESLEAVILTDNRLTALPPEIGRCRKLRKLMLTGNGLTGLPERMRECVELELLRLAANRIEALPDWLTRMPKLAWLALGGNPLCADSKEAGEMEWIPWLELKVLEVLGQGASGVIHQAVWRQDGGTERLVAVKIFKGALTSDGLPTSEMAASLAAGRHGHLVPILGSVSDHAEGASALVMDLIERSFLNLAGPPSLQTITRDIYPEGRRFRIAAILRIALGVAEAAEHLHGRGILHGDLYAHNILWQPDRHHAFLSDFGAASGHEAASERAVRLQRLEVRAFGLLLEELMERCDDAAAEVAWEVLADLRDECLGADPDRRPLFEEVVWRLHRISAQKKPAGPEEPAG